jgi:hypothetical protein
MHAYWQQVSVWRAWSNLKLISRDKLLELTSSQPANWRCTFKNRVQYPCTYTCYRRIVVHHTQINKIFTEDYRRGLLELMKLLQYRDGYRSDHAWSSAFFLCEAEACWAAANAIAMIDLWTMAHMARGCTGRKVHAFACKNGCTSTGADGWSYPPFNLIDLSLSWNTWNEKSKRMYTED